MFLSTLLSYTQCGPLDIAADKGHHEIVQKLLEAGARVNYQSQVEYYARTQKGCKQRKLMQGSFFLNKKSALELHHYSQLSCPFSR